MKKAISKKEAITYICQEKNGTMKDLIKNLGSTNVKALEVTGFIKRGQEKKSKEDTWATTSISRQIFYKEESKKTFMDKVHNYINYSLMRNTTKPSLA